MAICLRHEIIFVLVVLVLFLLDVRALVVVILAGIVLELRHAGSTPLFFFVVVAILL